MDTEKPFKVEVIADASGEWCGNGLRFATLKEAEVYGADLSWRWTVVRAWRVLENDKEVAKVLLA